MVMLVSHFSISDIKHYFCSKVVGVEKQTYTLGRSFIIVFTCFTAAVAGVRCDVLGSRKQEAGNDCSCAPLLLLSDYIIKEKTVLLQKKDSEGFGFVLRGAKGENHLHDRGFYSSC